MMQLKFNLDSWFKIYGFSYFLVCMHMDDVSSVINSSFFLAEVLFILACMCRIHLSFFTQKIVCGLMYTFYYLV